MMLMILMHKVYFILMAATFIKEGVDIITIVLIKEEVIVVGLVAGIMVVITVQEVVGITIMAV